MAYVVTDACIKCKYTDCVAVCPVNCFYEGANMLAIDPEQCIDCGVCVPECPAQAIVSDTDPKATEWLAHNRRHSALWPNLTHKKTPPADADQYRGQANKKALFDPTPGQGD